MNAPLGLGGVSEVVQDVFWVQINCKSELFIALRNVEVMLNLIRNFTIFSLIV